MEEITAEKLKEAAEKTIAEVMPEEKSDTESLEDKKTEARDDKSAEKTKSRQKGKTELSKSNNGTA